jgi:hypothetical protein
MADAFAIVPDKGVYHDLAMALSITANGHRVWTYSASGSQVMGTRGAKLAGNIVHLARQGGNQRVRGQRPDDADRQRAGDDRR